MVSSSLLTCSLPFRRVYLIHACMAGQWGVARISENMMEKLSDATKEFQKEKHRISEAMEKEKFEMFKKRSSFERANSNQPFYRNVKGKRNKWR